MDVPPLMVTLVLGFGEEVRVVGVLLDLKSEINLPAADGGARGGGVCDVSALVWVFDEEEEGISVRACGRLVM